MNADVLKGQWHQLKGEVKSRWGKLTDDDLDRASGDTEKLIGRLQERYGYARDEAKREVCDSGKWGKHDVMRQKQVANFQWIQYDAHE